VSQLELSNRRLNVVGPINSDVRQLPIWLNFSMTSDRPNLPEQVLQPPVEAGGAPPSDDLFAAGLRGFGPLGILAMLVIIAGQILAPLNAVLVLVWARRSRTPWHEIGYVRPQSWIGGLVVGLAFGGAFKFLMKAIVMPLLGADPINQAYHFLAGNGPAAAVFVPVLIIKAGFGEETFFRGYMFERLGKLLGQSSGAKVVTVLVTSVFFASLHYIEQGLAGVQQATITGLVFGTIFAFTGRIWVLMCAHVAFDLTALAMIYWGLESNVAHLVFK
jgi:membrane protease YdiL (CAAX protease family)